ncbi:PREDICTED: uncharacterized protein LOC108661644 [Theobroma cacao]|uniref:Uncharacterized protein LOC108661644 n=1 Tax=Theobroma cacao TaxID=3641 RepID=A0AB32W3V3_THECC|nr:PREDICTED: uncharacterized protein LOC108661644 [Theobroma cacao]
MSVTSNLQDYPALVLHPFTVSYLIETFGFSKKYALTISKHINFETSEKPDSIIAFFKNQGFSETHITRMVKTHPSILNDVGVPLSNIISMLRIQPQILFKSPSKLKEIGDTIKNMGFDPTGKRYLYALFVYSSMTKATWDKKVDLFKKLGWSEEEICKAFHLQPICMKTSEDKITAIMSFLVNKMGFTPSANLLF